MAVENTLPSPTPHDSSFNFWGRLLPLLSLTTNASSVVASAINGVLMTLVMEMTQVVFRWIWARISFSLHVTATFSQPDAAYEWIIFYLAEQDVWRDKIKDLSITAVNGSHRAEYDAFTDPGFKLEDIANCAPAADHVQRFRWKRYWAEVEFVQHKEAYGERPPAQLKLSLYTRNTTVLHALVKEAHEAYKTRGKKSVIIRSVNISRYHELGWSTTKAKVPRPSESLILDDGAVAKLVKDVERFRASEDWYHAKGVPYHRGYLLYGPPGTGKTSTIYTIAGHFGLPIHMFSLSGRSLSDVSLMDLFSSIPKYAIVVMEDIDCVFPPSLVNREDSDSALDRNGLPMPTFNEQATMVTLSGLLNVLDGVGSEDGRILFATTNYRETLDPALTRPGRFDFTIPYTLATSSQASRLFSHLFSEMTTNTSEHPLSSEELSTLAEEFSGIIPEQSFSMAELQGYLISYKDDAHLAVKSARAWVEQVMVDRERIEVYRSEKRRAAQAKRDRSSSVGPSSMPFRDCGRGKSIGESEACLREETSGGGTLFSESNASALCSPSSGPSEIVLSTNDSPAVDIDEEKLDDQSPTEAEPVSMDDVSA